MAFIDKQSQEISKNAKVTRKDKASAPYYKRQRICIAQIKNSVAFTTRWPITLLRVLKKTAKE